uniref:AAA+ ATPase domain-containing protein n=1 Tax=Brassica oleracea TaxID=3712 RepID=A0A3P6FPG1_BRAOL|nr:unnamed protein product [Brassica oleracea]
MATTFNVICSDRFHLKGANPPGRFSRTVYSRISELNLSVARTKNLSFSCRRLGRFSCNSEVKRLVNGENGTSKGTRRRRFSLRLRPRLRLLSMRLGRFDLRASLEDFRLFLRKNIKRVILSTGVAVIFGLCYLFLRLTAVPSPSIVPYSDFVTNLRGGSVSKVLLEEGSRRIYYNTAEENVEVVEDVDTEVAVTRDVRPKVRALAPVWKYVTRKVDHDEKFLLGLMREKGITYTSAPQSALKSMRTALITIITLWIPLTPLMWLLYRQLSASNSPAKKRRSKNPTVGFDDVEGVDSAKDELVEIVSCLQGSINYKKLGARLPRGVLLVGPPGTGKTLLARAVAGEAGVPFFSVSASEFVEMFVGRGAARIRDLFSAARKNSPSIIFIDELDAVGGKRGRSFNDERDQTLNQLLTEMDGFESDIKVIVIAATNRPEALDPALCRPGRFSRKVVVAEPDQEGRRKILAVHLRDVPLEEDAFLICDLVASLTPGFVGADLANIVNEAALLAARRGGEAVAREDIMEAIERAKYGINDKEVKARTLGNELSKLFPWMPSLAGRNGPDQDGLQGPLGGDDPQRLKKIAAAAYEYDNDSRWVDYWSNILIPPHMASRPEVVEHYKRKFYQRYVDPDLVVEPMASSSYSSQSARPSASTNANEQARSRNSGSVPRTTGPSATAGASPSSGRWDQQTIQFSVNAWVFVIAVLAVLPLVPKNLSNRAYRLSFMGTACSSLYSLYSLYGRPSAWNMQGLQVYFQSIMGAKDFIYFIYCLTFVTSHLCVKFALIPILCRALEQLAKFLRRNFARSTIYRKYLEDPCVWVESNTTTLNILSSQAEIAIGFLLIISLLSWQRNIIQTFMYWQVRLFKCFSCFAFGSESSYLSIGSTSPTIEANVSSTSNSRIPPEHVEQNRDDGESDYPTVRSLLEYSGHCRQEMVVQVKNQQKNAEVTFETP